MNKSVLVIATILSATAVLPVAAFASGTVTPTPTNTPTPTMTATPTPTPQTQACQTIYGGGTTCETTQLILDKTVQDPQSGAFVDNLGVNNAKYNPDGTVNFKLTVRNTGTSTFNTVTVTDTLPDYVVFTSGDSKTHTFTVNNLTPNNSQTIDVSAKIASAAALPSDQGITCVTNTAKAVSGDQSATDTAQFCIQQQVLGATPAPTTKGGLTVYPTPTNAKTTPPTGPEALALVGLVPSSLLGFILRKKTSR